MRGAYDGTPRPVRSTSGGGSTAVVYVILVGARPVQSAFNRPDNAGGPAQMAWKRVFSPV